MNNKLALKIWQWRQQFLENWAKRWTWRQTRHWCKTRLAWMLCPKFYFKELINMHVFHFLTTFSKRHVGLHASSAKVWHARKVWYFWISDSFGDAWPITEVENIWFSCYENKQWFYIYISNFNSGFKSSLLFPMPLLLLHVRVFENWNTLGLLPYWYLR